MDKTRRVLMSFLSFPKIIGMGPITITPAVLTLPSFDCLKINIIVANMRMTIPAQTNPAPK